MTAVEKLLAAHLSDVRETARLALSRADALEALIGRLSNQFVSPVPQSRGLRRADGWSPDEDALISEEYPDGGTPACRNLLPHRTPLAIRVRAQRLGIERKRKQRMWCSQCERNMLPAEAYACQSPFCKAGKAVA